MTDKVKQEMVDIVEAAQKLSAASNQPLSEVIDALSRVSVASWGRPKKRRGVLKTLLTFLIWSFVIWFFIYGVFSFIGDL